MAPPPDKGDSAFRCAVTITKVTGERSLKCLGTRIVPADPARSLLLLKPTAAVPHKGGQRFDVDSEYKVLSILRRNRVPRADPRITKPWW